MKVGKFIRQFGKELSADRINDVAAMMTYYAIFALFPMIAFVVTIALLVTPSDLIQRGVTLATTGLPGDAATMIRDQVTRVEQAASAGFAIGGALLALWGASRGAASLMSALNDMYDKEESRGWVKRQLIAIGTTLVVATLLILAMLAITVGPEVAEYLRFGAVLATAWTVICWLVAMVIVMLTWAVLYKWLPDTDAPFRVFTPGAAVGVVLWVGVTAAFGVYLDHWGNYQKTYGAVGAVIAFMTWLWLSNLALLLGAELNDVLADARKHGDAASAELADAERPVDQKKAAGRQSGAHQSA